MTKKLISIALCLVMLLSVLPVGAAGEDGGDSHSPASDNYVKVKSVHRKVCTIDKCKDPHTEDPSFGSHSPDFSDVWSSSATEHWKECSCGIKTEKGKHNFDETGKCTVCEKEHDHTMKWTAADNNTHNGVCKGCPYTVTGESCTPKTEYSVSKSSHWHKCEKCKNTLSKASHVWNGDNECDECAYICDHTDTTHQMKHSETEHWQVCKTCKVEIPDTRGAHSSENVTEVDGTYHTGTCDTCEATFTEKHEFSAWTLEDGKHSHTCNACGATESHGEDDLGSWEAVDGETHKRTCTVENCDYSETKAHTYSATTWTDDDEAGDHYKACDADCGYENHENHAYTEGEYEDDHESGQHYQLCTSDGCGHKDYSSHTYGDTYEVDPDKDDHFQTCTTGNCGHAEHENHASTGDWVALEGNKKQHGKLCDKCEAVAETEKHSFSYVPNKTEGGHDRKCSVCGYTTVTAQEHTYIGPDPFHCFRCKEAREDAPEAADYKMTQETLQWTMGSTEGAVFTSNAPYIDEVTDVLVFQYVEVDGSIIDPANYDVVSGSTKVTLHADYLETLSRGKHTISIVSLCKDGSTKVSATFEIVRDNEEYVVVFKMNGHGKHVAKQIVEDGETVRKPHNPKEKGYIFCGWYTDRHLHHKFDFRTEIHEDTVLYAKWIKASPVPKTGDNSNTALWAAVLVAGLAVTGMALIPQNKKLGK